jgi:hypothetical protein
MLFSRGEKHMTNVTELINTRCIYNEIQQHESHPEKHQPIYVVFTSPEGTRKAVEKAGKFMDFSKHAIEVLGVKTVPYALPLDEPPVPLEVFAGNLKEIAREFPPIKKVSAYLCRDELETFKQVLKPSCPVVMGVRKTLWPDHNRHLAQKLRHAGYDVILIEME